MPIVFTKDGFRFFFYSNDHTPIHGHVKRGAAEAVFVVEGEVVLRESVGMKTSALAKAEHIASEPQQLIIQKWHEYFD